jgi:hypothetical protein
MLAPAAREELLGEIAKAVDGQGGGFNVDYETSLHCPPCLRPTEMTAYPTPHAPVESMH